MTPVVQRLELAYVSERGEGHPYAYFASADGETAFHMPFDAWRADGEPRVLTVTRVAGEHQASFSYSAA